MDAEGYFREFGSIFSGFIYCIISIYFYIIRDPYESEIYVTGSESVEKKENSLYQRVGGERILKSLRDESESVKY